MKNLKKLFKEKTLLLLLLPLIVATTCEDDDLNSGFETEYIIQNNSSINLILITELDTQITIESKTSYNFNSALNQTTDSISPSESFIFSNIKLYKAENGNFILVYDQDPIDDGLWIFSEPSENRYQYDLVITDDLIN